MRWGLGRGRKFATSLRASCSDMPPLPSSCQAAATHSLPFVTPSLGEQHPVAHLYSTVPDGVRDYPYLHYRRVPGGIAGFRPGVSGGSR